MGIFLNIFIGVLIAFVVLVIKAITFYNNNKLYFEDCDLYFDGSLHRFYQKNMSEIKKIEKFENWLEFFKPHYGFNVFVANSLKLLISPVILLIIQAFIGLPILIAFFGILYLISLFTLSNYISSAFYKVKSLIDHYKIVK